MRHISEQRMQNVDPNFAHDVRKACEAIIQSGRRESYGEFARRFGLHHWFDREQITAALTFNMIEDAWWEQPFTSVAVVRLKDDLPGPGFFEAAAELERYAGSDKRQYVEREWQALRTQCARVRVAA